MRGDAAGDAWTPTLGCAHSHAGVSGLCGHVGHINQFDVEDEIGFCGDAGMVGSVVGDGSNSIGELPGNKEAALAADLHTAKALVEAGNEASHALREWHGLRRAHFGLSVVAEHGLAVLVLLGLSGMVEGGVELDAVGGAVAGVIHLEKLARLGVCAGADFDVLITECEGGFDDASHGGNTGRQLDAGGRGRCGRLGCGCCRLGSGYSGFGGRLGACGHSGCRQKEK